MEADEISNLPVTLAIRLSLDSVSYSNCLPDWLNAISIDYISRENRIRKSIEEYLGGRHPERAFEMPVPKKAGGYNNWAMPSVNDQIVIQACVSSIADRLEQECIDSRKVFSCRLNRDPARLAFLENQVDAWKLFQLTAQERAASGRYVLQIDVRNAFESIRYPAFIEFINSHSTSSVATKLIDFLLSYFSAGKPGVPFINDAVFFLGNAYFSKVDAILRNHGADFVRFVDDYKIFGATQGEIEEILKGVRNDLRSLGFELNDQKLYLGEGENYLEAVSKLKYAEIAGSDYVDAAVQPDVISADDMVVQILNTLRDPDNTLHQGFGRLQMAALRRMRVRRVFSDLQGYDDSPDQQFKTSLSTNLEAINLIGVLLDRYRSSPVQTWRLVWVLYLCNMLFPRDDKSELSKKYEAIKAIVDDIASSDAVPPIAKLWARAVYKDASADIEALSLEELHNMGYLEEGGALYGH